MLKTAADNWGCRLCFSDFFQGCFNLCYRLDIVMRIMVMIYIEIFY